MKKLCILFLGFMPMLIFSQNIPQDWLGDWYGKLEIKSPKGILQTIDMEFHLAATTDSNKWQYTIVYDSGDKRDERKYFLVKRDSLPGLYEVDENNGIIINEIKMGNKMFQRFEVMGNVIYGITTYEKDRIIWELVSDNENIKYKSGYGNEDSPFVTTYYPTNYQRAVLTKKKPKKK